jgi:hypothetical protein
MTSPLSQPPRARQCRAWLLARRGAWSNHGQGLYLDANRAYCVETEVCTHTLLHIGTDEARFRAARGLGPNGALPKGVYCGLSCWDVFALSHDEAYDEFDATDARSEGVSARDVVEHCEWMRQVAPSCRGIDPTRFLKWHAAYVYHRHALGWKVPAIVEVLSVHATRDEAVAAARLPTAVARAQHHAGAAADDELLDDGAGADARGRVIAVGDAVELRVDTVRYVWDMAPLGLLDAALARAA